MVDVVMMPNTAVNMKETRKTRMKNGASERMKRERRRKRKGRKRNQLNKMSKTVSVLREYSFVKIFLFPTKLLTRDIKPNRNLCEETTIRAARSPRVFCDASLGAGYVFMMLRRKTMPNGKRTKMGKLRR